MSEVALPVRDDGDRGALGPAIHGRWTDAGRRLDLLLVLTATAFAFALRWQAATSTGLWRDETQFLDIVRLPGVSEMLSFLHYHESHPPLFYLLMRGWLWLTGGSDTAALLLSVLLGSAVVPALYFAGVRVFGRQVALMASCFSAFSFTQLSLSRQARPYAFLSVLAVLSIAFLWRALYARSAEETTRPRRGTWIGYIVATFAMIDIHNWPWLVLAAEWLIVLLSLLLQRVTALRWAYPTSTVVREWIVAQVIIFAAYLPWVPALIYQLKHAGHGPPPAEHLPLPVFWMLQTSLMLPLRHAAAHYVVPAAILGAACVTLLRTFAVRRRSAVESSAQRELSTASGLLLFGGVPVVTILLACLLGNFVAILFNRCLMIVMPAALLAFSALLALLLPSILCVAVSGLICVGLLNMTLLRIGIPKSNARELAVQVRPHVRPDDLIVVAPEALATSFNYYFPLLNDQIDYPELRRVMAVPFDDLLTRTADPARRVEVFNRLEDTRRRGRRVWLILLQPVAVNEPLDDAQVPPERLRTGDIYPLRANQVLERTIGLFGPPMQVYQPGPSSEDNLEDEVALLFEPRNNHGGAAAKPQQERAAGAVH